MAKERVYHQTLPGFGLVDQIDVTSPERGRQPYILSQPRLEAIGHFLDHPNLTITNPAETSWDMHHRIVYGLVLHSLIQTLDAWWLVVRSMPHENHDYQSNYQHLLTDVVPRSMPTAGPDARVIITILNDHRLMIPRSGLGDYNQKALETIHRIIAHKVNDRAQKLLTHSSAEALPGFHDWATLSAEIPFPSSHKMRHLWSHHEAKQALEKSATQILARRRAHTISPPDYGSAFASKLRLRGKLGRLNTIWSCRLDSTVIYQDRQGKKVSIIDYKSGRPKLPAWTSWTGQAVQLSIWINSLMAAHLHRPYSLRGVAVEINDPLRPIDYADNIGYTYIGHTPKGMVEYDLTRLVEPYCYQNGFDTMHNRLETFLRTIDTHRQRLQPLLDTRR